MKSSVRLQGVEEEWMMKRNQDGKMWGEGRMEKRGGWMKDD